MSKNSKNNKSSSEGAFWEILASEQMLDKIHKILDAHEIPREIEGRSNAIAFIIPFIEDHIHEVWNNLEKEEPKKWEPLFPKAYIDKLTRMLITAVVETNAPVLLRNPGSFFYNRLLTKESLCQKLFESHRERLAILEQDDDDDKYKQGTKGNLIDSLLATAEQDEQRAQIIRAFAEIISTKLAPVLHQSPNIINCIQIPVVETKENQRYVDWRADFARQWVEGPTQEDIERAGEFLDCFSDYVIGLATHNDLEAFAEAIKKALPGSNTLSSLEPFDATKKRLEENEKTHKLLRHQRRENASIYLLNALMYGGQKRYCPKKKSPEEKLLLNQAQHEGLAAEMKKLHKDAKKGAQKKFDERNKVLEKIAEHTKNGRQTVDRRVNPDPEGLEGKEKKGSLKRFKDSLERHRPSRELSSSAEEPTALSSGGRTGSDSNLLPARRHRRRTNSGKGPSSAESLVARPGLRRANTVNDSLGQKDTLEGEDNKPPGRFSRFSPIGRRKQKSTQHQETQASWGAVVAQVKDTHDKNRRSSTASSSEDTTTRSL